MTAEVNQSDLAEVRRLLDNIPTALTGAPRTQALRDTARAARDITRLKIRDVSTIKVKYLNRNVFPDLRQATNGKTALVVKGERIPAVGYQHRVSKANGVKFRPLKNGSWTQYLHAFKTTVGSHKGVFERDIDHQNYDGRLPIYEKGGPAMSAVLNNHPGVYAHVMNSSSKELLERVQKYSFDFLKGVA
ncbi:MAG: hypothetical protein V7731_01805 [Amphritea sp.]